MQTLHVARSKAGDLARKAARISVRYFALRLAALAAALVVASACIPVQPQTSGADTRFAELRLAGYYVPDAEYNIDVTDSRDPNMADLWDVVVGGSEIVTYLHLRADGTYRAFTLPGGPDHASSRERGTWTYDGRRVVLSYESGRKHIPERRLWVRDAYLYWPRRGENDFRSKRTTQELWDHVVQEADEDLVTEYLQHYAESACD